LVILPHIAYDYGTSIIVEAESASEAKKWVRRNYSDYGFSGLEAEGFGRNTYKFKLKKGFGSGGY